MEAKGRTEPRNSEIAQLLIKPSRNKLHNFSIKKNSLKQTCQKKKKRRNKNKLDYFTVFLSDTPRRGKYCAQLPTANPGCLEHSCRVVSQHSVSAPTENSCSRRIIQSFQSRRRASSWQCSDRIQSYSRHKLQTMDSNQDQRCNCKLIPPHHPSVQTPLSTNRHTSYQN